MTEPSREVRLEDAFRILEEAVPEAARRLEERFGLELDRRSFAVGQLSQVVPFLTGKTLVGWIDEHPETEVEYRRALERIVAAE